MKIFKILALLIGIAAAALLSMMVLGMAIAVAKLLFVLLIIGLLIAGAWKLFGGGGASASDATSDPGRLDHAELTIEEYKRKLEAQLNRPE